MSGLDSGMVSTARYRGPERRSRAVTDRRDVQDRNLPLWARMMAMVGIPGTIAFFLVYVGAQSMPALQQEVRDLRLAIERLSSVAESNRELTESNHRMLQRMCSSIMKSDEERSRCFDQ